MTIPKVRTGVKFFLDLPRTVQVIIEGIWGNPQASGYIAEDEDAYYDIINTGSKADEEREPSVSCNCQT